MLQDSTIYNPGLGIHISDMEFYEIDTPEDNLLSRIWLTGSLVLQGSAGTRWLVVAIDGATGEVNPGLSHTGNDTRGVARAGALGFGDDESTFYTTGQIDLPNEDDADIYVAYYDWQNPSFPEWCAAYEGYNSSISGDDAGSDVTVDRFDNYYLTGVAGGGQGESERVITMKFSRCAEPLPTAVGQDPRDVAALQPLRVQSGHVLVASYLGTAKDASFWVFDARGRLVGAIEASAPLLRAEFSGLEPGVYFVRALPSGSSA